MGDYRPDRQLLKGSDQLRMHSHRNDSFLITDNLRLEIVHESNPYYTGEPISLIVRIRHLGNQEDLSSLKEAIRKLHQENEAREQNTKNEDGSSWSMKSLLNAFKAESESKDSMSEAEREANARTQDLISKQLQFHKPVDLISGYVQVSGVFQFDPEFIDGSKMKDASTKLVGVDGLMNHTKDSNGLNSTHEVGTSIGDNSLAKFFNSKHSVSTVGLTSNLDEHSNLNGDGNALLGLGNMGTNVEYKSVPIFLVPQTLLFSELTLEPGKTTVYRFKSANLPKNLTPSYIISKNISVVFNLELGVSRLVHGEIKQYTIRVPITVAPYVTSTGCQYTSSLNHSPHIMVHANIREIKQKAFIQRMPSTPSIGYMSRRSSSFMGLQDKKDCVEGVLRNFVELVKSNQDSFKDIEKLVDSQLDMQFENEKIDEEEPMNNQSEESIKPYMQKKMGSVSSNISTLISLYGKSSGSGPEVKRASAAVPQLEDLRKMYQIKWNGQPITKLYLSRSFYTTSDDIDLVLELEPEKPPLHRVSAVTVSLESFELLNRDYAADPATLTRPRGNQIYESHAICFDTCDRIPLKILIPKTPMKQIPSQFKTDIFQFKWMLIMKFVLIPRKDNTPLEQFYEDSKGTLLHAKESIEGEDFSCHIPLPILPSAHNFGGW